MALEDQLDRLTESIRDLTAAVRALRAVSTAATPFPTQASLTAAGPTPDWLKAQATNLSAPTMWPTPAASAQPAPPPVLNTPDFLRQPAPPAKRRTRRAAASATSQAQFDPDEPVPEEKAAQDPLEALRGKTPTQPPGRPVGYEELKIALLALAAKKGETAAFNILKKHGVTHAKQLRADQYGPVLDDFTAATQELA